MTEHAPRTWPSSAGVWHGDYLRVGRGILHGCSEEFNPDEADAFGATEQPATSTGCIDKRNAHDVVVVGPIVQKVVQVYFSGN